MSCAGTADVHHRLPTHQSDLRLAIRSSAVRRHTGQIFDRGTLYKILNQRTYIGKVSYQGAAYPGEHAAILPRETWDAVQELLAENHTTRGNRNRTVVPGFLKGVARCGHCGSALTMSYTRKGSSGPMYRYYRCLASAKRGATTCPLTQIAAGDLERVVVGHLRAVLRSPSIIAATSAAAITTARADGEHLDHQQVLAAIRDLDGLWEELFPAEQERIVELLVDQIDIGLDHSELRLHLGRIGTLAHEVRGIPGVVLSDDHAVIPLAIHARRRCGRTTVVTTPDAAKPEPVETEPDALVVAIARAFRWQDQLETGRAASVSALAEREGLDEAFVRRQLRLTLQPPEIIESLVSGEGNAESIRSLTRSTPQKLW